MSLFLFHINVFVVLFLINCFTLSVNGQRIVVDILSVSNGGGWGSWYPVAYCPLNSFVVGFSMKVSIVI